MTCNNYINLETIVSKLIFHPGLEINTCPLVQINTFCFATTQKLVSLLERRLIHRDLIINNSGNIGNTGNSPE